MIFRWLCSKERFTEAGEILVKMATKNGVKFDEEMWKNFLVGKENDKVDIYMFL